MRNTLLHDDNAGDFLVKGYYNMSLMKNAESNSTLSFPAYAGMTESESIIHRTLICSLVIYLEIFQVEWLTYDNF